MTIETAKNLFDFCQASGVVFIVGVSVGIAVTAIAVLLESFIGGGE